MERRDFQTAWDQRRGKMVNAADLPATDLLGLEVHHRVVLVATRDEVGILSRGLHALRAQAELQSAVNNSTPEIEEFSQLERAVSTERKAEPMQMPEMPDGFFVTPVL